LPFKCFNCGKIGHFVAKCPYAKNESSDDEEDHNIKKERKPHQKGKHEKKKNSIRKIKVFTPKRKVAHLKRAMKVSPIVKEKKLFSWP
jgi:hypothetical protein